MQTRAAAARFRRAYSSPVRRKRTCDATSKTVVAALVKFAIIAGCLALAFAVWRHTTGTQHQPPAERAIAANGSTFPASLPGEVGRVPSGSRFAGYEHFQSGPNEFVIGATYRTPQGANVTSRFRTLTIAPPSAPATWPARNATPREVDLLAGLDVEVAIVANRWSREADGSIVSDLKRQTRIDLGYSPPAEYDLRFVFARLEGEDGIDVCIHAAGRNFYWTFAGWENSISGLGTVLGQTVESNETMLKRDDGWLTNCTPYTATIRVRRDRVQVSLDDELLCDFATDYRDLNPLGRMLHRRDSIGFSTWESQYAIYDVRLTEISGAGRRAGHSPRELADLHRRFDFRPIAALDFGVADRPPQIYFLWADGTITAPHVEGEWSLKDDQIAFRWGPFIDTCTLSADRKSFAGRNQGGDRIVGTVRAGAL